MAWTDADTIEQEMAFAKVVETDRGEAVLIGGRVYHVTGPDGNAAGAFSQAMRRAMRGDSSDGQCGSVIGMQAAVGSGSSNAQSR